MTEPREKWFDVPIEASGDLPEGWVFVDIGDGTLMPVMAMEPVSLDTEGK